MIYPWHQKPFEVVNKMIQQDHLPHALMITGSEGMGKFEFAMQLIEKLTGYQDLNVKDNAKLDLEQPTLLRRSFYQNLIYCRDSEINEETMKVSNEIRIKQVRAFCNALNKTADDLQIGLMFYADKMNISAANSLLKTLEEPRKHTLIILLVHEPKKLPITIRSRCQNIHIPPSFDESTINWIKEKLPIQQQQDFDIGQLLHNANGVPFNVVDDLNGNEFLEYQKRQNYLLSLASHPQKYPKKNEFEGDEKGLLKCLTNLVIEAIKIKQLNRATGLVELNEIANQAKLDFLYKFLDDLNHSSRLLNTSINIKLLLDNVLIVWSHISHLKRYPIIIDRN